MAWVYLDDQFPDHPKVARAGGDAAWLFVCGLAYCKRFKTDGRIPRNQVPRLSDRDDLEAVVATLLRVRLWEEAGEDDYLIHDYDDWNRPAESRSELGRKAAKARWDKERNASGNASASADASETHMPQDAHSLSHPLAEAVEVRSDLGRWLARPTAALVEEVEGMLLGLRAIYGEALNEALDGLGRAKFTYPSDLRHALERVLEIPRAPDPTEPTAAAAAKRYERTARRQSGEACPQCKDDGFILDEQDVAQPCRKCRLKVVGGE